ncbi:hypothetical protein CTI12_AA499510 [Artemisia annua]|uniref:Zinc finger, CCHC-type, Retrotransposon gag domain protein n=1 Tax=Artemisia annua TaxID=35608 RepID=A0A2U1LEC7_ARTAN|nr:hypothetical protein CTI12_AA499510 [Artemisia annua]
MEKIFEVLDCRDEFKARLAGYKLEGDALNWWKAYKQAKAVHEVSRISRGEGWNSGGFTDVAQVANAGRNIKLLREKNRENKRNRDGDRIRSVSASKVRDQTHHDSESTTTCEICGKWHPGKPCHKISGACFACGSIEHKITDCPRRK